MADLDWVPEFGLLDGLRDSYEKDFGRGTFRKEPDYTADDMVRERVCVCVCVRARVVLCVWREGVGSACAWSGVAACVCVGWDRLQRGVWCGGCRGGARVLTPHPLPWLAPPAAGAGAGEGQGVRHGVSSLPQPCLPAAQPAAAAALHPATMQHE